MLNVSRMLMIRPSSHGLMCVEPDLLILVKSNTTNLGS